MYFLKLQQQETGTQHTRKMETHNNNKYYDLKQIGRRYSKKSC